MNYKTEMTENNSTIQSLLSTLQNLPNLADAQQGAYVWKKLTAEGGDFVDFVVNDTETAYPDGGMQEGYWYEKVVEGITGIDFGTVTLSSSQSSVTVTHNLGKEPSFFLILIPKDQASMRMGYYWKYQGSDLGRELYYKIPTGDTSTSNTLTFKGLDRNNTYYWFAIA